MGVNLPSSVRLIDNSVRPENVPENRRKHQTRQKGLECQPPQLFHLLFIFSAIASTVKMDRRADQGSRFPADKAHMFVLPFAAAIAAAMIAGLFLLALRNQKQGWRRQRGAPWQVQRTAVAALVSSPDPVLRHIADLTRLQQSLAEQSQTVPKKDFVRNR
jgi:heme/copper-type cytochrome/quinol oxidase subunit 1